jgi:hypothetical protein
MKKRDFRWEKVMGISVFGALCALTLTAGQVWAQFASATNTAAQQFGPPAAIGGGGCGVKIIDLNGAAAGTDLTIFYPAAGPLVALFNAECSVDGLTDAKWLDVNVLVNGVAAAPSNDDNAFCTSTGDGALEHWVSASTNVIRQVAAGFHTIRVTANLVGCVNGVDAFRLDDTSLIASRP